MNNKEQFNKPYLGSKPTQAFSGGVANGVQSGFLITAGTHTGDLIQTAAPFALGVGVYGFFDWETRLSVVAASASVTGGKPLLLAGTSIRQNDTLGMHGGYAESSKSKMINPKFITGFKKILCAAPEQAVCHLGNTNFTSTTTLALTTAGAGYTDGIYTNVVTTTSGAGSGLTVDVEIVGGIVVSVVENNIGSGYVATDTLGLDDPSLGVPSTAAVFTISEVGSCEFKFDCGRTYYLSIKLKGSAVLGVFNHEMPRRFAAYTGCCPANTTVPTAVDSTLVMLDWAKQVIADPYLGNFLRPIVYDQAQNPWFATAAEAVAAGYAATDIFDLYPQNNPVIPGALAGIRFAAAYVDTQFGNCSFDITDSYLQSPVQIVQLQLVDESGNPCNETLCNVCEHTGFHGQGFGEDVLRQFIEDSTWRQSTFADDARIREIEEGNAYFAAIDRTRLYTRYIITHIVPVKLSSSNTFSEEIYNLNIYIPCTGSTTPTTTAFETFMTAWLAGAGNSQVTLETFGHTAFTYAAI